MSRLVEGDDYRKVSTLEPKSGSNADLDNEKRDFWDSFGGAPKGPSKDKEDFWVSFGSAPKGPPKEKQGFWDDFAAAGELGQSKQKSSTVGTAAMKTGGTSGGTGPANSAGQAGQEDAWKDW